MTNANEILLQEQKPRNIRQMIYRIVYLWVLRVELRVEDKTKAVFRKTVFTRGSERNVAVRAKR